MKTSIFEKVSECARKYNCILITGDDGNGITSIMRNVVLFFEEEEYEIYPITTPVYIQQLYSPSKKILFCVENVCGRYDCEYHDIQLWSSLEIYMKMMLEENNVKFIVSCRHRVLKDSQFQKLKLFHSCICDLSDDNYKYSENDLRQIAEMYNVKCISFKDNIYQVYEKTECFPLLCCLYYKINKKYNHDVTVKEFPLTPYSLIKSQLDELIKTGDFKKYCALALCVMFDNQLEEAFFNGEISDEIEHVFTDTCDACRVPSSTTRKDLLKSLESLDDFVLKKENGVFSAVHDRLFDCLLFLLGQRIIKCIIEHAQTNVIMQRFIFKEYMAKSNEYKILIPKDVLPIYFERLLRDWSNREVVHVFSNKNLTDETFQGTLTCYITNHRSKSKKEYLANVIAIELKETPLTMSCSKGYNKIVSWLINNSADVNECRYDGASPFLLACQEGNSEVVTELIKAGSDISLPDIDGRVPLYAACQYNHYKIVQILFKNGVEPSHCTKEGISPLMISSENGNKDIVYHLLEKHADVNYCNRSGISALFLACEVGHADVAKLLFERDADVNLCIKDGSSPLYIACQNGHLSTVNSLLNTSVDINKGSYSGATPLSISCQEGHVKIVETLIKHGANVNIYRYVSPLFIACEHGHLEVVKVLLQTVIDVDKCKFKSLTPLHISCQQGNTKMVAELLKKNADINMCSAEGKSPLFIACQENQLEVVYLLLNMKEKLDINKCTVDQRSPLFEACLRGNLEMIKVLVENGADINIVDNEGHSALSVAPENKRYRIELFFKK